MDYNKISDFIIDQFPDVYKENGEGLIAFTKAYYQFIDEKYGSNKDTLETIDIDSTMEEYLIHFKKAYLADFPFVAYSDTRFLVKHILDFYKSKGSALSSELLIKLLFGDSSKIVYPSENIFKLSDSKWFVPEYIEVESKKSNYSLVDKTIFGSKSKASAIVEGVVTKRINGKYIDAIYISNVKGKFVRKEHILTEDGLIKDSPVVVGSLTNIEITSGGKDTKVGEVFEVESVNGRQGKARVKEIENATGRVEFSIEDGGYGFTVNSDTEIKISDAVISLKNDLLEFIDEETLYQHIEKLNLLSTTGKESELQIGKTVIGVDAANNQLCSGVIAKQRIGTGSGSIDVLMTEGTFSDQKRMSLSHNIYLNAGDVIFQEKELSFSYAGNTAPFAVGFAVKQTEELNNSHSKITLNTTGSPVLNISDRITQYNANNDLLITSSVGSANSTHVVLVDINYHNGANSVNISLPLRNETTSNNFVVSNPQYGPIFSTNLKYAAGKIKAIAPNYVELDECWGNFEEGKNVKVYNVSNVMVGQAIISNTVVTLDHTFAEVSQANSSSVNVFNINGVFQSGKKVSNMKGTARAIISNIQNSGANDVLLSNNSKVVLDTVQDMSASGVVIGQNATSVGIYGNNHPFLTSSAAIIPNSGRLLSTAFLKQNGFLEITSQTAHGLLVGDLIKLNLDIENSTGVYNISGIYTIEEITSSTVFAISLEQIYVDLLSNLTYVTFTSSSFDKIFDVKIKTQREKMISPPLLNNGEIKNIEKTVLTTFSGFGASFQIEQLENEETVFLNTDMLKDHNIKEIDYVDLKINGSNAGMGSLSNIIITNGGSGYANGQSVTFIGGGYGNGEPERPCAAIISTDGAGAIIGATITDTGSGYYGEPTYSLPVTSGNNAYLDLYMRYGYGFVKNPLGNMDTLIKDLLTERQFTIGKISDLYKINPGTNYNASPYIKVFNRYIVGFDKTNVMIELSGPANFKVGENVYQLEGGVRSFKGQVVGVEDNYVTLERTSFSMNLNVGENLVGEETFYSVPVVNFFQIEGDNVMGNNSIINAKTVSANGIIKEIEIIDSGFGYEDGDIVKLSRQGFPFVIEGISDVSKHGKGEGYWLDNKSHASGTSKIRDSEYYQEFSYEVVTNRSLDKYQELLKKMIHVSGTKMFGRVETENHLHVKKENLNVTSIRTDLLNFDIDTLFRNNTKGFRYKFNNSSNLKTSHLGTGVVSNLGTNIGYVSPINGNFVGKQSDATKKPVWARVPKGGLRNTIIPSSHNLDTWFLTNINVTAYEGASVLTPSTLPNTGKSIISGELNGLDSSGGVTFSGLFKPDGENIVVLRIESDTWMHSGAYTINLANNTIGYSLAGTAVHHSGTCVPVGNGWRKVVIKLTPRNTPTSGSRVKICPKTEAPWTSVSGAEKIQVKNIQLEAGFNETNYQKVTNIFDVVETIPAKNLFSYSENYVNNTTYWVINGTFVPNYVNVVGDIYGTEIEPDMKRYALYDRTNNQWIYTRTDWPAGNGRKSITFTAPAGCSNASFYPAASQDGSRQIYANVLNSQVTPGKVYTISWYVQDNKVGGLQMEEGFMMSEYVKNETVYNVDTNITPSTYYMFDDMNNDQMLVDFETGIYGCAWVDIEGNVYFEDDLVLSGNTDILKSKQVAEIIYLNRSLNPTERKYLTEYWESVYK